MTGEQLNSGEPLLPVVSEDTLTDISAGMLTNEQMETEALREMATDNPILAEGIARLCMALGQGNAEQTAHCTMSAVVVYMALKAQAEADRMSGVPTT